VLLRVSTGFVPRSFDKATQHYRPGVLSEALPVQYNSLPASFNFSAISIGDTAFRNPPLVCHAPIRTLGMQCCVVDSPSCARFVVSHTQFNASQLTPSIVPTKDVQQFRDALGSANSSELVSAMQCQCFNVSDVRYWLGALSWWISVNSWALVCCVYI
jgi:hypothetical protein